MVIDFLGAVGKTYNTQWLYVMTRSSCILQCKLHDISIAHRVNIVDIPTNSNDLYITYWWL